MAWIVKPKRSNNAGAVPTTANLADGEVAINTADRKIYMRVGAAIVELFKNLTKSDVGLDQVENVALSTWAGSSNITTLGLIGNKTYFNAGIDLTNEDITNVNNISFSDPGNSEGLYWGGGNGWRIYEAPDNLTNSAGNLQMVCSGTRIMSIRADGSVDIPTGLLTIQGSTAYHATNLSFGSGLSASTVGGVTTISVSGSSSGTVTSVGLSLPSIFSVTGSPVTTSGTLTASLASQTAKTFLAAPSGAAGVPTFRAIVASDIPTLNQNTTGSSGSCTGNAATATTANYANSAGSASSLSTSRSINGTSFNGSADITTANWGTTRTITIGSTSKSVNGGSNVSWSLSEIGAAPTSNPAFAGTTTVAGLIQSSGTDLLLGASGGWIYFRPYGTNSSTGQGYITTSGVFYGADFSASSDSRLKKNIQPFVADAPLNPVVYERISTGETEIGFIADEVEKDYPHLVSTDDEGFKSLSYSKLTAVLAYQVNLLNEKVAALEARLGGC